MDDEVSLETRDGVHLSCSFTEHSIDEGHDGRLQVHFVSVASGGSIQVYQQSLDTDTKFSLSPDPGPHHKTTKDTHTS